MLRRQSSEAGLRFDDSRKLLNVLERLVDLGNTVVVIERQLDVIKSVDWLIDLGPEGGAAGGQWVAAGTPEEIAAIADNATGRYLKPPLQPASNGQVRRRRPVRVPIRCTDKGNPFERLSSTTACSPYHVHFSPMNQGFPTVHA